LSIFLFLCLVVGLNWVSDRFWCRYLCPLGAFLGITSRLSLFRRQVNESCTDCGLCARICPTGTIDAKKSYASDPAECTLCYDCLAECPVNAITYRSKLPNWHVARSQPYDPKKRETLLALAGALGGVALAGIEPIRKRQSERMIRPPGALQTDFSSLCIRCGECVRVCPTQGLQHSLLEGGWQNILTPRLIPRLGYCSFNCTACIQACPSGAIPAMTLVEKQSTRIGLASINTDRCLPWAYDTICTVCEEMCPLPDKAIKLIDADVILNGGEKIILKKPIVKRELCIGCGICEYHCPQDGEAAIQVQTLPDSENYIPGI
jgi:ferredoxin